MIYGKGKEKVFILEGETQANHGLSTHTCSRDKGKQVNANGMDDLAKINKIFIDKNVKNVQILKNIV